MQRTGKRERNAKNLNDISPEGLREHPTGATRKADCVGLGYRYPQKDEENDHDFWVGCRDGLRRG